jgi:hypothetical protein
MRKLLDSERGSAQMIGVVVALLVSIIVGVLIWYKINAAIYTSTGFSHTSLAGNALFNASNSTANTIWTLFPIVGIVVIAGIILAIVTNFGRGQGA